MKNKFVKLVHLVGFITKKFVTMYGHTNVKFVLCHTGSEVCVCLSVYLYVCVSVKSTYRSVHQTVRLRQRSANPVFVNILPSC